METQRAPVARRPVGQGDAQCVVHGGEYRCAMKLVHRALCGMASSPWQRCVCTGTNMVRERVAPFASFLVP
eukprot:11186929-Lingulodinium_polyedra.AAC.1